MCQIKTDYKPLDITDTIIMPGNTYIFTYGTNVLMTRCPEYKLQCKHENGEWEDTPELKDGETLYCEPETELKLVHL